MLNLSWGRSVFTGLVECTGTIDNIGDGQGIKAFWIVPRAGKNFEAHLGDSIAVNGACLTVATRSDRALEFHVSRETLSLTHLGSLRPGDRVNLERSVTLGTRLGGHLVSGHVDGMATLLTREEQSDGWLYRVRLEPTLSRYVIAKGSICLDGVSLTVNRLEDTPEGALVDLMLIPTTLEHTTLGELRPGWQFNAEVDMLAKYIERLLPHKLAGCQG